MKTGWKNVLFSTHTKPAYMPPPQYGDQMVVCGPHYQTSKDAAGNFISVQTPLRQPYDIASLISALPAQQKPELVIVRVDAGMENIPGNLAAVNVPKLVILGDSHHMQNPIQNLILYARAQRFDYVLVDHNKQHAHWYLEAGIKNVVWMPALLLARDLLPPVTNPERKITFIGQVGDHHPARSQLVQHISTTDLPLDVDSVPQYMAAKRYNCSGISLNGSLNGDFNLRIFEVLASGGMLMTDRLSPLSGLYALLTDGEEFVEYGSHADFVEKATYYLANTPERNKIARRGFNRISRLMSMQARSKTLQQLVRKGKINPLFTIDSDLRMSAYSCRSKADLFFRISVYEWVQEQHRQFDGISVINTGSGDIRIMCDLADLQRLCLFSSASGQNEETVTQSGLGAVINFFGDAAEPPARADRNVIIVCAAGLDGCLEIYDPGAVVIAGFPELGEQQQATLADRFTAAGYKFGATFGGLAFRPDIWLPSK